MNAHFPDNLCRLLYVSELSDPRGQGGSSDCVAAIAEQAASKNKQSGITGCLVQNGTQFIQLLEGPPEAVEATFERICRDFRHDELHLVDMVAVQDRIFPKWSMACLTSHCEEGSELEPALDEISFLVNINANQAVEQMRLLLNA